jgi:hypothetical protein
LKHLQYMPHWLSVTHATLRQDISWQSAWRGIEKKYETDITIKTTAPMATNIVERVLKFFHQVKFVIAYPIFLL